MPRDASRSPAPSSLRARYRGALLGVALGDALGAGLEGRLGVPADVLERIGRGVEEGRVPLRYTDDTHMTLGLAESLLACRGFDGAHMAARFAERFAAEPWRGYGPGPPQVFRLLADGVSWDEAGRRLFGGAGSFGNGAAMRVAPAALFAAPDLERVRGLARETARITHAHELGLEGAALQAAGVALLLEWPDAEPLDRAAVLEGVRAAAPSRVFREKLERLEALGPDAEPGRVARELGNGIEAFESVPSALCAFLRHPDSFRDAVGFALRLGGDTDTIGSMAGALAGARLGEERIPRAWRERVEDAPLLCDLADRLLELRAESAD